MKIQLSPQRSKERQLAKLVYTPNEAEWEKYVELHREILEKYPILQEKARQQAAYNFRRRRQDPRLLIETKISPKRYQAWQEFFIARVTINLARGVMTKDRDTNNSFLLKLAEELPSFVTVGERRGLIVGLPKRPFI